MAWCGITDTLLVDEEGVAGGGPVAWFFIGVRTALVEEDREWSTTPEVDKWFSRGSLVGG